MKLIIVESPTKAKTISKFLGNDFIVESCQGHIRDLPRGKMGIDIENNFQPQYVIPTKKRKIVNKLKKLANQAETIYFATDEDREGEAIAFHLQQVLGTEKPIKGKRIVFHEITLEAIEEALKNPREIDLNLVQAQEGRRILDRLVGYELSPFLWRKIAKGLSAGRVQSPALRLIIEREREIEKFKPEEYWSIEALLQPETSSDKNFTAKLYKINDLVLNKLTIKSRVEADKIIKDLKKAKYVVLNFKTREQQKNPLPPFTTSTLQQEANRKLGFLAKKTMLIAQQLYEGISLGKKEAVGLITYMRTDSLNLAEKFLNEAAEFIKNNYGKEYLERRQYKTKSKVAQEAHEAIRPTSCFRQPEKIKKYLSKDQYKLYNLIWSRAISCQMRSARLINTTVDIIAQVYTFRANGSSLKFDGWLKIYPERQIETILPPLKINEKLKLIKLLPEQHFTEPLPRYNDASLVKTLESLGIGRPSTYAPIISTLQERNYIYREQRYFKPTKIGFLVNDLLVSHFPEIVDYQFTARMEDNLDKIANGQENWLPMIKNFYGPFKEKLKNKEKEIAKNYLAEKTEEICPKCGKPLVIKMSRFGRFLACSGFPECQFTKSLNNSHQQSTGIKCPKCQIGEIIQKRTKRGKFFYGCNRWPKCNYASWQKPTPE
ncbi:MAG: type I DNA topoisomerase [Patescibacteria group bacterium]